MKYVSDTIVFPQPQEDLLSYSVPIPSYHRAAVGIFPGTKLFLLHIPKTRDLIVTSIEPRHWGDLWKLEAALTDTPGAARSIVHTLVQNNVNILIQEGVSDYSHSGGITHQMFLLLDLQDYESDIDGNTLHRNMDQKPSLKPNHLITNILATSADYIRTRPSEDYWSFSFHRMAFFYGNKEYTGDSEQTYLTNRSISVPKLIINQIYDGTPPNIIACHMISDTEEKHIKIRFLERNTHYLLLRIEHKEEVGAILSFMNILKKHDANITTSYCRLTRIHQSALWHALVELPLPFSQSDLEALLNSFDQLQNVKSFSIKSHFGFPFDVCAYASELKLEKYSPLLPEATPSTKILPVKPPSDNVIERRLKLKPYYSSHSDWELKKSTVFIAMPYDDQYEEFYRDHIKDTIESCGLHALRADKHYEGDTLTPLTDHLRRYIATCEFLVADVTGHKPNVVYEVGLAHAIGKHVLFICDKRYKQEKGLPFDLRGYQHVFYSFFEVSSFDEEFKKRINTMKAHM